MSSALHCERDNNEIIYGNGKVNGNSIDADLQTDNQNEGF